MTPTLSAVIPTCCRPRMLARALASVKSQDRDPDQVVVVHDGPAEALASTREVVDAAALPRALVISNPRRHGASSARNAGAQACDSTLVAFLDDDDEWLPPYVASVLALFEQRSLDMVCCDFLEQHPGGQDRLEKVAPATLARDDFLLGNPGLRASNLVIRDTVLAAVGGFAEDLASMNDLDLGLRLATHPGLRYQALPRPLVRFHQHGQPRLSTPGSAAKRSGVAQFWARHHHLMSGAQRQQFRHLVRKRWGVDELGEPWEASRC